MSFVSCSFKPESVLESCVKLDFWLILSTSKQMFDVLLK